MKHPGSESAALPVGGRNDPPRFRGPRSFDQRQLIPRVLPGTKSHATEWLARAPAYDPDVHGWEARESALVSEPAEELGGWRASVRDSTIAWLRVA